MKQQWKLVWTRIFMQQETMHKHLIQTLWVWAIVWSISNSQHIWECKNSRSLQSTEQPIFYLNSVSYIQMKIFLSFVFFINIESHERPVIIRGNPNTKAWWTLFHKLIHIILERFPLDMINLWRPLCWDSPRAKSKPVTMPGIISTGDVEVIAPSFGHFFETLLEILCCFCSTIPIGIDC